MPIRVNITAQGLSTPDPSLSPTHLSVRRGRITTTHYTHHQVSLMVSRNTTRVPSLGLRIGPACKAGLSAGMRRERVPPNRREKERRKNLEKCNHLSYTAARSGPSTLDQQPTHQRPSPYCCITVRRSAVLITVPIKGLTESITGYSHQNTWFSWLALWLTGITAVFTQLLKCPSITILNM